MDIYLGKYLLLATSTSVNNCYLVKLLENLSTDSYKEEEQEQEITTAKKVPQLKKYGNEGKKLHKVKIELPLK